MVLLPEKDQVVVGKLSEAEAMYFLQLQVAVGEVKGTSCLQLPVVGGRGGRGNLMSAIAGRGKSG
jgi:hypothetical protein